MPSRDLIPSIVNKISSFCVEYVAVVPFKAHLKTVVSDTSIPSILIGKSLAPSNVIFPSPTLTRTSLPEFSLE